MGRYWTMRVPIGELRMKKREVKQLAMFASIVESRYEGFCGIDIEPPRAVLAFREERDAIRAWNGLRASGLRNLENPREEELATVLTKDGVV